MQMENVLKKPLLTEKTSLMTEVANRYAFVVDRKANKYQIKDAVEKLYDVKVVNIKTTVLPGKQKRTGRHVKKTNSFKKAFVQLAEGQKIEFFKGI
jgi:large subunit ribosomal protein L23